MGNKDVKELRKILNDMKNIVFPDFNDENPDEYIKKVDKIIYDKIKLFFSIMTSFETDPQLRLYKVRQFKGIDDVSKYKEHSYVPEKHCSLQRGNYAHRPVLYCAEHPTTAVLEVAKDDYANYTDEDKHFIVSSWEFTDITDVKFASFLDGNFKSIKHFKNTFEIRPNMISENYKGNDFEDFVNIYNDYITYLSELFLQKQSKYHISAYFAHNYFYRGNITADVIIYPSIQVNNRAVNYAIKTDTVDSKMNIKCLYHISIDQLDYDNELIKTSLYDIGIVKGKKITWIKIDKKKKEHQKYLDQFHKDFGDNV